MRKANPCAATLPLLLAACAVGPDYRPPAIPTASAGGNFVSAPSGTDSHPAQDRWWRLYDDPALDRLVGQAFAANTDLRVAAANLARAQAVLREAAAGRLPSTSLGGGISHGNVVPGQGGGGDAQWSYNATLNVAWEVDLSGRLRRSIEAARGDAQASEAARDRVAVTIAAETTRAYADACALAQAEAVARRSIGIAQQGLDLTQTRKGAGAATQFDVERSATALAEARATLPALTGRRQIRLFELAALLGLPPAQVPEDARRCVAPPAPVAAIPVGDGAALLARRPDVREAERQLAADTARIGVASADLYPRISLGGSGGFFRNDQVKGSDSFSFFIGPLLSWSFPNMAVARARIAQAEAQTHSSLARFDGVVLTALKEVDQALAAYAAAGQRSEALGEAVRRADSAYQLADRRYRAGAISFLELLDSQRQLVSNESARSEAIQTLGSARVDLFKALGGGWQSVPMDAASRSAPAQ
ncbi:TolC family protein [Sphingomonas sp.]|uniref:TolC family protein n=1 Tax=Sphingomonas sp. TaxID=28214 RepID=UPI0031DE22EA